jgi:hypothetical protein
MGVRLRSVLLWTLSLAIFAGAFAFTPAGMLASLDTPAFLPAPLVVDRDPKLVQGPGGPILVVGSGDNPFSTYYAEILRTEGLNAFAVADIADVTPAVLADYDVAVIGEMPLTAAQVSTISKWVEGGGNLIAMRPDAKLLPLLGLTAARGESAEAYLRLDASVPAGAGITPQTMQFHGSATHYGLADATPVAMLYGDAKTATDFPAVTVRAVGTTGGQGAAFAYDLARSVVYTRQGNPAWAMQRRDGEAGPIRADNLFYGAARHDLQPDWVDFDKIEIPQADEQQRLLANLITVMAADRMPVPRFWYFPRGVAAAVVMTMDEHGGGDVPGRLERYNALSPAGCSVDEWACVRSTTYMFATAAITDGEIARFQDDGYEFGVHVDTGCADFSHASLNRAYATQMAALQSKFPDLEPQVTERTHCIAYGDWLSQPVTELMHGIRFDTNYYYWPPTWLKDRPGLFTGSGMPMRFADTDGEMIDVFQAATQLTNESGQSYPRTIDVLLDNAVGERGYYGAFVANIHTDGGPEADREADDIVAAAMARGVPVISASQLLDWVDGRNGSTFSAMRWQDGVFAFTIAVDGRANGLVAMLPRQSGAGTLKAISCGGAAVAFEDRRIKGIDYAMFPVRPGACKAHYGD